MFESAYLDIICNNFEILQRGYSDVIIKQDVDINIWVFNCFFVASHSINPSTAKIPIHMINKYQSIFFMF